MTAQILTALPVVDHLKSDLKSRVAELKSRGVIPCMSVVLVGDNPASLSYIRKLCEEVGSTFKLVQLPTSISEKDFLQQLKSLNQDLTIHGIIIQLPVSDHLKKLDIANLVVPEKDIDGFHKDNTNAIYSGSTNLKLMLPCTPKGVLYLLKFYGIELAGKHVVVIGRSLIVGKPLSMLLSNFDATVTLAHSKTKNLAEITKIADIIVVAIGKTHFIQASHLNPSKKTIIIDVGMNTLNGKLTGDVAPDVLNVAGAVTPVPGGVGPMTVLSLIENLITAAENKLKG